VVVFTPTEKKCIDAIIAVKDELPYKVLAYQLGYSVTNLKQHVHKIYGKTGVKSMLALYIWLNERTDSNGQYMLDLRRPLQGSEVSPQDESS